MRQLAGRSAACDFPGTQHSNFSGEFFHFAQLVRDEHYRKAALPRHLSHESKNLFGFRRREYAGRLIENQYAVVEEQLFQYLKLLLFTGSEARHRTFEVEPEGHGRLKRL